MKEQKVETITPKELACLQEEGKNPLLIDVRTDDEYHQGHARGAIHLQLDLLRSDDLLSRYAEEIKSGPIYFICRSGGRSDAACKRMIEAGINNVVNVWGGTLAWDEEGLPLEY
jgi:rhodanese-related sulfurtransferase